MMVRVMQKNERDDRLLRPLNTLDGRDVIQLLSRVQEECGDMGVMNDTKRIDNLLRP